MAERPRAIRVFVDIADPWSRRVLRDALGVHPDVRFVSTASSADVLIGDQQRVADKTMAGVESPTNHEAHQLTDREREVLQALSEGLSNGAIGERLGISRSTVKFHLHAIFEKLGVRKRAEAVAMGVRRGDVLL